MNIYKVGNTNNYVSINKNDLRRIYLLHQLESNNDVELGENGKPIKFKNQSLQEFKIKEEDLYIFLDLYYENLDEKILYNNRDGEYLHSVRVDKSPYSVIRRARDIDQILEDEYLRDKIHQKVKVNWNVVIENVDDKTIMKYFNSDKFQKEAYNCLLVDEFVKSDPLFNTEKLKSIINNFDFNKEEDRLKAVELLDKEIKENLDNGKVDINIKELIKSNPNYFDLDKLIKGEEKIILNVFQEIELEKDGHIIKLEASKEEDITDKIIEELSKKQFFDDPSVENKQLTEEEIQRRYQVNDNILEM